MIPAGLSFNYIFNNQPVSKSKYIFADKNTNLNFNGYRKIFSDNYFSVFEKTLIDRFDNDSTNELNKNFSLKVDEKTKPTEYFFESFDNLLLNGNFNNGLTNWVQDGSVFLNDNYIKIIGSKNRNNQIIQSVLTTSSHIYRLSYNFKGNCEKSYAIIRDEDNNTERYLFMNPSKTWVPYSKKFISYKTGIYYLYLTCAGTGDACFSSVSITDVSNMNNE